MNRQEILEKLITIFEIASNEAAPENISEDSTLRYDLRITSVGLIYLVIGIEEDFGVDMSEVYFSKFNTVKEVIDYIEEKLASNKR